MSPRKVFRHIFKFHGFWGSLTLAFKGILYLFLYHRNMRLIFLMGILAATMGFYFKLKGIEIVALCITITLVFMAEIFNTAIEMLMDMLTAKYHLRIKLVKDIAAGVVVLTCLNAIVVGYILFVRKLPPPTFAQSEVSQIERSQELIEKEKAIRDNIDQKYKTFINKVIVSGATLLTAEQIRQASSQIEGHWFTTSELQRISDPFRAAYENKGLQDKVGGIDCEFKEGNLIVNITEVTP